MKYLEEPRIYKLNNGLNVALLGTDNSNIFARLRVNFGSYQDQKGEEGLAHLLEHCIHWESEKYSQMETKKRFGRFGITNASTSLVDTSYLAAMLNDDFERWLDLISNQMKCPLFNEQILASEKNIVLQELFGKITSPTYHLDREITNLLYKDHPKSIEGIGNEKSIRKATVNDLQKVHQRGYSANNMDLFVVGDLPKNVEELVEKYFGDMKTGEDTRIKFPKVKPINGKTIIHRPYGEIIPANPEISPAGVNLIFNSPLFQDIKNNSANLAIHILGGDFESPLFRRIREEEGLAYEISVNHDSTESSGIDSIFTKVPANGIDRALQIIFEEMQKMKDKNVDDETVEKWKRAVKYSVLEGLENKSGIMNTLAWKFDWGMTNQKYLEQIEAITPDSIRESAQKYFPNPDGDYILSIRDPLLKFQQNGGKI